MENWVWNDMRVINVYSVTKSVFSSKGVGWWDFSWPGGWGKIFNLHSHINFLTKKWIPSALEFNFRLINKRGSFGFLVGRNFRGWHWWLFQVHVCPAGWRGEWIYKNGPNVRFVHIIDHFCLVSGYGDICPWTQDYSQQSSVQTWVTCNSLLTFGVDSKWNCLSELSEPFLSQTRI